MKKLSWFVVMACLTLARGWTAELVKVWQITTNQIGEEGGVYYLSGVAPDGASLLSAGPKLVWISEGKVVWSGGKEPGNNYPLLLNQSNLVFLNGTGGGALEGSVRWLRRQNDFIGEKIIVLSKDQPIIPFVAPYDLASRYLPHEQIPHFLTKSSVDGTLTCWRLDDPDIWPPPAITASPATDAKWWPKS